MTKYLIFADVQGDKEHMKPFVSLSNSIPRDRTLCLGDIINSGKTTDENQVIELLKGLKNLSAIRGNHEDKYREKVKSTDSDKLTDKNADFISQLLPIFCNGKVLAYHSSLVHPDENLLRGFLEWETAAVKRKSPDCKYILFGHSHSPQILCYKNNTAYEIPISDVVNLEEGLYFINPGSISEPRFTKKRTFATLDDEKGEVRFYEIKRRTHRKL